MSNSESEQFDLLDRLAEEFAARFRRGEHPSLKEYIDRYSELADDIRELFPAMVKVEQIDEGHVNNELTTGGRAAAPRQIGDYRILGELGRGGMGVVYEAEQVSLGRRVALKVLPRHVASDRMTLERFRREARAAARLHHTNIVPVFEVGQDAETRFYAMQFIQGQSLDAVITELRHLRIRVAIKSQRRGEGEEPPRNTNAGPVGRQVDLVGRLPAPGRTPFNFGDRPESDRGGKPASAALALARAAGVDLEVTEAVPLAEFTFDSSSTPTPL